MQATQPANTVSAPAPAVPAAAAPDTAVRPAEAVQPIAAIPGRAPDGRDLQQTLADVAEHLRQYLKSMARDLEFQVDLDSRQTVIIVRDAAGSVVRQIPGEEALRFQQQLNEGSGTFLDRVI